MEAKSCVFSFFILTWFLKQFTFDGHSKNEKMNKLLSSLIQNVHIFPKTKFMTKLTSTCY